MIELKQIDFWKKAVLAISSFVPEGNFRFSDKGISLRAIDPSQVVLVDYFVDKKFFDKYDIEPSFVGVDLVEFTKIIQRSLPNDKMFLDLSETEIKVRFESELKRNFKLPLIDISGEEAKLPEIEYDVKIDIDAFSLKELLRDASLFGSSIVLKTIQGKFFVEARGTQGELSSEAARVAQVSSKKDVTAKFSLNFFQNIIKEADSEKHISLELKTDAPMRITYALGPSKIVFYLAHMIL